MKMNTKLLFLISIVLFIGGVSPFFNFAISFQADEHTVSDLIHYPFWPADTVNQDSAEIAGRKVEYSVRAGTLPQVDDNGKELARIFFIAYTKNGTKNPGDRPLLFSFNGGPGSASVWMHLGLLGPKRVRLQEEGFRTFPPYVLIPNEYSILDRADLVFIDPVSTGFSRALPGIEAGQFHGFREDLRSISEFIRMYLSSFDRWESPVFLIGESYGSRRAAGLASQLQNRIGLDLSGIILVSAGSLGQQYGNFGMLQYALNLPHFAATAWYHKKLADDLQTKSLEDFMQEVEAFTLGEYMTALIRGNLLTGAQRTKIVTQLARYTGLSEEFIDDTHLRIDLARFRKELLRRQNKTVGRLDSRFTGVDSDEAGETPGYDPSYSEIRGPFTVTINNYLRKELGYRTPLKYAVSGDVRPWTPAPDLNLLESLRDAMAYNSNLYVMVADGYYDKLYFWPSFTFSQFDFNQEIRQRVKIEKYEAGHMMYIQQASLAKMKTDIAAFFDRALKSR
jgi:carboxypeptidase C (cathepsin A)